MSKLVKIRQQSILFFCTGLLQSAEIYDISYLVHQLFVVFKKKWEAKPTSSVCFRIFSKNVKEIVRSRSVNRDCGAFVPAYEFGRPSVKCLVIVHLVLGQ